MLNVKSLPPEVLSALKERELSDAEIALLSPREAFDEYCNWHGLIHWGDRLWGVVEGLQANAAEAKPH